MEAVEKTTVGATREDKHMIITGAISRLEAAVCSLSELRERVEGTSQPTSGEGKVEKVPCLHDVLMSLPDHLNHLTDSINDERTRLSELLF
jgi:hypothetical protein